MKLIDSHSHLHFHKSFPDFDEVIERATLCGVTKQVLIGCEMKDSMRACEFVQDKTFLNWTIGVHPHDSNEITDENLKKIRGILAREGEYASIEKGPVAVGEIGLDYYRNFHSPEVQKKAFEKQLQLAMEFGLPVVIHVRDAFDDIRSIIDGSGVKKLVFHCFSEGLVQAEWAWNRGFLTSFTGSVTYPKNTVLMDVVKNVPANMYMLETDCPFLPPQVHRGKRNEPAFVRDIAEHVAELRGETLDKVAMDTTSNAEKFFEI